MYIVEVQYKLKPDADVEEAKRLYNEIALPIYRKIPGLKFNAYFEYDREPFEWDCVYLEVWDSKEAHDKALGTYIGMNTDSELAKTGYYEKIGPMSEKYSMSGASVIASSIE